MITTFTREEEAQETEKPLYQASRYGVLDNQLNITDSSSYGGYQTLETETPTETIQDVPAYEVEKEYNIEGIKEDDIVIVPTFMPTIESKIQPTVRENTNVKLSLNARGKIIVSVFSIVAVLLMAFTIYNAVVIGRLNASLATRQMELTNLEQMVNDAEASYNDITSVDNILASLPGTYKEAGENVVIELAERPVIKSAPEKTNWFDKICEFISGLFD